ncbi:MAG: amidohydrolase family protein [Gammaproteobacteria bacterium]|nr:amidohydrolase family protein [Gammaproteobacteria bacterium]
MANEDLFVALTECHFMNTQTMSEIAYYPAMKRWNDSVDGVLRAWAGRDLASEWPHPLAEALIGYMDEARVDVCFCLREPMMDISGGSASMSTNGFMLQQIEPYPGRMYLEANCGPVIRRGLEHAIWELEYLVKERGAKLCKMYQPEDAGPINDRRLWPFYARAEELGVPLTVHTGNSYVVPQPGSHCDVRQLDDVMLAFPDLKVIAYHAGWPDTEALIGPRDARGAAEELGLCPAHARGQGQDTRPEPRPAHRHRSGEAQLTTRPGPGGPGLRLAGAGTVRAGGAGLDPRETELATYSNRCSEVILWRH